MHVNIKIPDELNETRKTLSVTWSQVIQAGLQSLQGSKPSLDYASLESNLKTAVTYLTKVWDSIKKAKA